MASDFTWMANLSTPHRAEPPDSILPRQDSPPSALSNTALTLVSSMASSTMSAFTITNSLKDKCNHYTIQTTEKSHHKNSKSATHGAFLRHQMTAPKMVQQLRAIRSL